MEGMYGYSEDKPLMSPENLLIPSEYHSLIINHSSTTTTTTTTTPPPPPPFGGGDDLISEAASINPYNIQHSDHDSQHEGETCSTVIKSKIASHRLYPRLLQSYIDCHKVGAPPEVARVLEEIGRESQLASTGQQAQQPVGVDAELDEFMETYCEILEKYRLDLSKPFDEATSFLNDIEYQLRNLCKDVFVTNTHTAASDEGVASSDEEYSGGETDVHDLQPKDEERVLKDELLRRFGSHISNLKLEFSKKKKKGKLPREARHTLFEWWNAHFKWPYPTEADKIALAEATGLDQRQINNWFINQRKRHWKPSENMQYTLMDNISGQYFTDD